MRINAKGRVTIPLAIRTRAGLAPGTAVAIAWDGTAIRLTPMPAPPAPGQGEALVAHLRGHARGPMTTNDIMALTRGE